MTDFVSSIKVPETARRNGRLSDGERFVPEEIPVAFSYGGSTHAVMMAPPVSSPWAGSSWAVVRGRRAYREDFATGFGHTGGIIGDPAEIDAIEIVAEDKGIDLQVRLADAQNDALTARRRHMAGPVGCGLCGIESIEQAVRVTPSVRSSTLTLSEDEVVEAVRLLNGQQPLHMATRAVHGAGFYVPGAGLVAVREDVGRHNALDKLVGAARRAGHAGGAGAGGGTSRGSVEMVQKTAIIGSPFIIAISAPTALAIRTAEEAGMTLFTLVRGEEVENFSGAGPIRSGPERRAGNG